MDEILQDDQREERNDSLAQRLGVERWFYLQAIRAAVNFTTAAPADGNLRQWRQWGARNLGGRVRGLAQNPRNPSTIYAGSAQGGVFRSDDGGDTWQPIGTPADSFPVGALALAPGNPNILYVGTGEPAILHDTPFPSPPLPAVTLAGREAAAAGLGFFRYDAATGIFTNEVGPALPAPGTAGAADSYAAIAVDPQNENRCWIASHTGLWRREPVAPRFRPEPIPTNPPPVAPRLGACVSDVILVENWNPDRRATYRIFAAVAGTGIFRGVFDPNPAPTMTWDPILAGNLPAPGALGALPYDRIRIAACKSFPNHLYAVFENAGDHSILNIFRSADGGNSWQPCAVPANLGTQAWSNLCMVVHANNPAILVVGNVNVARSVDSGTTWQTIIDWSNFTSVDRAQHGDTHALIFDLREPNRLWVGNDGGISSTPDVVNANPLAERTWRKRSHGLCISQFNDITSHPNYPFMLGGGLQDNGTYITFAGPTWVPVGDADGGQMCFEINNPRQYVAPDQGSAAPSFNLIQSMVVAGSSVDPVPGFYPLIVRTPIPDLPSPPSDTFAVQLSQPATVPAALGGLFVQNSLHHPVQVNNLMAGRTGDIAVSTDGGANYVVGGASAAPGIAPGDDVTALAYGPGATVAASDWWIGTNNGAVLLGTGAVKAWANVTPPAPPPGLAGVIITSIAVHPSNSNYVVVATGGNAAGIAQGRIFLSNNRGVNWMDITGLAVASVLGGPPPGAVAGPLNALPPCPFTGLAFDPTVAAANPQVLYVGTLAGVFVIRNLPRRPAIIPPIVPPAAFNPDWRAFNGLAPATLPLTLVNDLEIVNLPARPGAVANSPESMQRLRLYAAMYGRGIFVCDVSPAYPAGVPSGGPPRRLYIRQHLVEDGLAYPRPTPTVLNAPRAAPNYNQPQMQGDPRLPAMAVPAPPAAFSDLSALDIRIDNQPFQFFDEVLDGVEFDEELRTKNLVPGQVNAIYVQVHNAGWDQFTQPVDVHLFFAQGALPAAVADPAPLPDLHDNFWSNFTVEPQLPPPAGALAANAARWQRTGKKQTIPANRLSAAYPAVVRFEWTPPVSLVPGKFVGLLAVCTNPEDPLPAPAAMALVMRNLVRNERRVVFRLAAIDPYVPNVYIRDDVEDTGLPASGSFAGRSPDIIVVQSAEADPNTAFRDLQDTHNGDRIRAGVPQIIYVRVFNRRNVQVQANVEVQWVKPNAATTAADAHAPSFDGSKWIRVTPVGTASIPVPPQSWAIATVTWQAIDVPPLDATPGAFNAIGFVALVSSTEGAQDRAPQASRVFDAASFWEFFSRMADSKNAAFRAVLYGDGS